MPQDINVIALVKGEERYVFLFNDETRAETLRTLGRYASNPEMSFNWYDAAVLSQKVRRTTNVSNDASDRQIEISDNDFPSFDDVLFDDLLFDD